MMHLSSFFPNITLCHFCLVRQTDILCCGLFGPIIPLYLTNIRLQWANRERERVQEKIHKICSAVCWHFVIVWLAIWNGFWHIASVAGRSSHCCNIKIMYSRKPTNLCNADATIYSFAVCLLSSAHPDALSAVTKCWAKVISIVNLRL